MESSRILPTLLKVAGLAGAVALVWYYTADAKPKKDEMNEERAIQVLDDLLNDLHPVFSEVAMVAKNIKKSIENNKMQSQVSTRALMTQLMNQGFANKIEITKSNVLNKHNLDSNLFEQLLTPFEQSPEVQSRLLSMDTMFEEALQGELPVLPNTTIDTRFSDPDLVLSILQEVFEQKTTRFLEILKESDSAFNGLPPSLLETQRLLQAHDEADEAALAAHGLEPVAESQETWLSLKGLFRQAVAHHLRDNESFARAKDEIDRIGQDRLREILRPGVKDFAAPPMVTDSEWVDEQASIISTVD